MTKLTKKDIIHVAKLAKLELKTSETEKFKKQLTKVISYIERLNEVPTNKVKPTSQTTGLTNVMRKDKVSSKNCLTQKEALSGTDKTYNNYFVVPGIFEETNDK